MRVLCIKFLLIAFHLNAAFDLCRGTPELEARFASCDGFVKLGKAFGAHVLETVF